MRRLTCRCFTVIVVGLVTLRATAGGSDNSTLQKAVARAMAGRRGTAVVVDVQSGHVLAAYHLDVAARRVVHPGSSWRYDGTPHPGLGRGVFERVAGEWTDVGSGHPVLLRDRDDHDRGPTPPARSLYLSDASGNAGEPATFRAPPAADPARWRTSPTGPAVTGQPLMAGTWSHAP